MAQRRIVARVAVADEPGELWEQVGSGPASAEQRYRGPGFQGVGHDGPPDEGRAAQNEDSHGSRTYRLAGTPSLTRRVPALLRRKSLFPGRICGKINNSVNNRRVYRVNELDEITVMTTGISMTCRDPASRV
jgi:hypothetical protein